MIRQATTEDAVALESFLARHPETSMFLRSNLAAHGTDNVTHPHGTRYFLWMRRDGVAGVFGLTNGGFLMCQIPGADAQACAAFARAILGGTVKGMTGDASQVGAVLTALDLPQDAFSLYHDEPLYRLELKDLTTAPAQLSQVRPDDQACLLTWFRDFELETGLAADLEAAQKSAERRMAATLAGGTVRVLRRNDQPVAMAALNAQVQDMVQVGGVFVPKSQRGQGLGSAVTAALLHEARALGANTAILFANSPPAARAYERIGFQKIGTYRVAMLRAPQTIGART